jgi:hypothetical protein
VKGLKRNASGCLVLRAESVAGECLLSPFCQDTKHGRELRERVIGGGATAAGKAVPEVFMSVLQEAAMKAGLAGDKGLLRVNALHSREVFRATIRSMSNGSAPGGSGISYAELKCMSDDTLNLLSGLCNVSVAAGLPPTEWCKQGNRLHDPEGGWRGCH